MHCNYLYNFYNLLTQCILYIGHTREQLMATPNLVSTAVLNPFTDPEFHNLVTRHQTHSCTNYCLRGAVTECRLGFPKPACQRTHIDLDTTKIIYQRSRFDKDIFNYNAYLLKFIRANMNIQINNDENVLFYLAKYSTSPRWMM